MSCLNGIKALLFNIHDATNHFKISPSESSLMPNAHFQQSGGFMYDGNELLWCEWWTLYFYGVQDEIDGMINYIFLKAANSVGSVFIYNAFVYPKELARHIEYDTYNLKEWKADANRTMIQIGDDNFFQQNEDKSITVRGHSKSNLMKWDLTITPKFEPLFVCKDFAFHSGQTLNFVSLVPAGNVKGTVTFESKQYAIDSFGEVEHIWGPALLPALTWQFIHGFDAKTNTMIYILHVPDRGGAICIEYEKERYFFNEYDWKNTILDVHYPQRIDISNDVISIVIKTSSISASEANSASENHVFIQVKFKGKVLKLEGMSEYNAGGWKKLIGSAIN